MIKVGDKVNVLGDIFPGVWSGRAMKVTGKTSDGKFLVFDPYLKVDMKKKESDLRLAESTNEAEGLNRSQQLVALCEGQDWIVLDKEQEALAWDIADDTGVTYKVASACVYYAAWYVENIKDIPSNSIWRPLIKPDTNNKIATKELAEMWAKKGAVPVEILGEFRSAVLRAQRDKRQAFNANKPPRPKAVKLPRDPNAPRPMTKSEFERMCKGARRDWEADNKHDSFNGGEPMDFGQVAYDMADSMLYDDRLLAYCQKAYNTTNRTFIKELLADNLAG